MLLFYTFCILFKNVGKIKRLKT